MPHDSGVVGTGGSVGGTVARLGTGGISDIDAPVGLRDASPGTGEMGGMGAGGLIGGAGGGLGGGAGATVSGGGITGTGGSEGTATGGRTVGTAGSAGGGIGGSGGTVAGGSGGVGTAGGSGTGGTASSDAGQDSNGLCGSKVCRYGEYCCQTPCASLCMPEAHPCTGFVCSPGDAGYEVYPSDCQLRVPTGHDAISCNTEPGLPNYYVCGSSLLGPPCVVQGGILGSVGGDFCCP